MPVGQSASQYSRFFVAKEERIKKHVILKPRSIRSNIV